jgi:hypothetical protein
VSLLLKAITNNSDKSQLEGIDKKMPSRNNRVTTTNDIFRHLDVLLEAKILTMKKPLQYLSEEE